MLTVETAFGQVLWADGLPAKLLLLDGRVLPEGASQGQAACAPEVDARVERHLRVVLVFDPRRPVLPPLSVVLARMAGDSWDSAEIVLNGHHFLENFGPTREWLVELEGALQASRSTLAPSYEFAARSSALQSEVWDFVLPRIERVTIVATDHGQDEAESGALADHMAQMADVGVMVRPTLCLTRYNASGWEKWAETWLAVSHGAGVNFARPEVVGREWRRALESLPSWESVAEFLTSAYRAERYDLWRTRPFSTLLEAIFFGSASILRCGHDGLLAVSAEHGALACPHGSDAPRGVVSTCRCRWAPLCDAVCAPCPALSARARTPPWRSWERLFCPALGAVILSLFDDLARAARAQQAMTARPGDMRLRVASGVGALRFSAQRLQVGGGRARVLDHGQP